MGTSHRWSGWPGAWCLDCGIEDQSELCIATHDTAITCVEGHVMCEESHEMQRCTEHRNGDCPEPGSKRNDPYAAREEA